MSHSDGLLYSDHSSSHILSHLRILGFDPWNRFSTLWNILLTINNRIWRWGEWLGNLILFSSDKTAAWVDTVLRTIRLHKEVWCMRNFTVFNSFLRAVEPRTVYHEVTYTLILFWTHLSQFVITHPLERLYTAPYHLTWAYSFWCYDSRNGEMNTVKNTDTSRLSMHCCYS